MPPVGRGTPELASFPQIKSWICIFPNLEDIVLGAHRRIVQVDTLYQPSLGTAELFFEIGKSAASIFIKIANHLVCDT